MPESPSSDSNSHRALAIEANNSAWELLDGRDFTDTDVDDLLERAYAAAYHWRRAADVTAVNLLRAAWLVSRAQAVAGHGEAALHHARRCGELTEHAGSEAADFDVAYALEALARALACHGDLEAAAATRDEARAIEIRDDEDRRLVEGDLAAAPWFGLDA